MIDHVDTRIEVSEHSPSPFLVRLVDSFLLPLPPETTSLQGRPIMMQTRPNCSTLPNPDAESTYPDTNVSKSTQCNSAARLRGPNGKP